MSRLLVCYELNTIVESITATETMEQYIKALKYFGVYLLPVGEFKEDLSFSSCYWFSGFRFSNSDLQRKYTFSEMTKKNKWNFNQATKEAVIDNFLFAKEEEQKSYLSSEFPCEGVFDLIQSTRGIFQYSCYATCTFNDGYSLVYKSYYPSEIYKNTDLTKKTKALMLDTIVTPDGEVIRLYYNNKAEQFPSHYSLSDGQDNVFTMQSSNKIIESSFYIRNLMSNLITKDVFSCVFMVRNIYELNKSVSFSPIIRSYVSRSFRLDIEF